MIVENLSNKIATFLYENTSNKEKHTYNKLYYGLQIIVNFLIVLTGLIITSALLGILVKALMIFASFAILRQFSGGIHLKSSELCSIISIAIIVVLSELPDMTYQVWPDVTSTIIMVLFSPATFKVRYKKRKIAYLSMKVVSIIIILLNLFIIKSSYISVSFILQSLFVVLEYYKLKREEVVL